MGEGRVSRRALIFLPLAATASAQNGNANGARTETKAADRDDEGIGAGWACWGWLSCSA